MGVKIDISQCRKADVIVTTGNGAFSGIIRSGVGASVSHAMLYLGDQNVLEAIASGVKKRSWDQAISADGPVTLAIALRRKHMDDNARQAVVDAAIKYENLPYDMTGAVGSGMFGDLRGATIAGVGCIVSGAVCVATAREIAENAKDENADKAFFCSELVTRAFTAADHPIVDGKATWQTPGAVRVSRYLMYIGHLIDTPPKKLDFSRKTPYERVY